MYETWICVTQGKMRAYGSMASSSPPKPIRRQSLGPLPLTTDTASSKPSAPQLMTRAKTPSKQTLGAKKACQTGNRGHATYTAAVQSARPPEPRPGGGVVDLKHARQ